MAIDPSVVFKIRQPEAADPLEQFAKAAGLRNVLAQQQDRAQRAEETALDIQEKRRQMSAAEQHRQLFADPQTAAMMKDAPEKLVPLLYSIDPKFGQSFETGLATRKKDRLELEKSQLELAGKKADRIGSIIQSATDAKTGFIPDEGTAHQVVSRMLGEGLIEKPHADKFFSMPWGPETQSAIAQFANGSISAKDQIQARLNATEAGQKTEKHNADILKGKAELPGIQAKATQETLVADAMLHPADQEAQEMALTPAQRAESASRTRVFNQSLKQFEENVRHNKASEGETRRYHNMSVEGVSLTPAAMDKMAEMFATTGVLPAFGMGAAAAKTRSQVINQAAAKFPNVDFASNKAAFQANNASLSSLQRQQDAVEAFEKTATANLDRFLSTAKGVVDSGIPLLNAPLRQISDKLMGSENMAGFRAARQVATTEVAKVLSGALGSTVLSDSARKEVQELTGPDATLKQMYRAAEILKQDMGSRKESYREQIAAIKGRIGTGEPKPGAVEKWDFDADGKLVKK